MSLKKAPPLLSRVLLVVSSILAVGALFLFFSQALEPVSVSPLPPSGIAKPFNPKADVSNNPSFKRMHLSDITVPEFQQGKENPFLPASISAQTESSATTTETIPESAMESATSVFPEPL